MSCLCLGPTRAGKSHLLKALQNDKSIDETTYSVPTNGTSIYKIPLPIFTNTKQTSSKGGRNISSDKISPNANHGPQFIDVMEIGGKMAPLWHRYFNDRDVKKIIYVVDTSNLCQISAAGVLLYSILTEPRLQQTKFLLVLSKMDYAYRQMRNEALLMLQMSKLQKELRQSMTITEASAVTREGLDNIYHWLKDS